MRKRCKAAWGRCASGTIQVRVGVHKRLCAAWEDTQVCRRGTAWSGMMCKGDARVPGVSAEGLGNVGRRRLTVATCALPRRFSLDFLEKLAWKIVNWKV